MAEKAHKQTKRGFVMTGGGAKGLYEAGVIHAFHLCGMEFDVITGSSIGAINSIFYAEYQYRKQQLSPDIRADAETAVEAMDPFVRTFLHVWWQMPQFRIIDDSDEGPLGQLKNDLANFDLSLPQIVRLGWWWTTPNRGVTNSVGVWPDMVRLIKEAVERLGNGREFLHLWSEARRKGRPLAPTVVRAYLARFSVDEALVPGPAAMRLKEVFTEPATPLRPEHLAGAPDAPQPGEPTQALLDPKRTMRDFANAGIDVRLTRTNFRTGRLEVSSYVTAEQFINFLRSNAWRWQRAGSRAIALGSERLYLVGNPRAIDAALGSGRFPGVFAPMPVSEMYDFEDAGDTENQLLEKLLSHWLDDTSLRDALFAAYQGSDDLSNRYESWRESHTLQQLFPNINDAYVDGGTIDNTPANSAIDAVKDWADANDVSLRDLTLDLYTVFLHPSPDPGQLSAAQPPSSFEVVQRTLEIQSAAKLASNATEVQTINHFGARAEELGEIADALVQGLADTLDNLPADLTETLTDEQRNNLEAALHARLAPWLEKATERDGGSVTSNLERVQRHVQRRLDKGLPLQVEPIEIYPDAMPMSTLQFTERLGYRPENAISMMTIGCYNTLWEMREYLENKPRDERDAQDETALTLARKWMGFDDWPDAPDKTLLRTWACQRTTCVFHAQHCAHGARVAQA